ncbi:MAG: PP2C family protein-serine/threonine phosphatase [Trebonia sp.]
MAMDRRDDALRVLLSTGRRAHPDDLPALVRHAGASLGADEVVVYVIDYDQLLLTPMLAKVSDLDRVPLAVEGTLAGRAYATTQAQQGRGGGGVTLWLPLLDGAQRLGVVEMVFADRVELDPQLRWEGVHLATLIGELSATRALYGDAIETSRRRMPMSTETELQRLLLPPLTFATAELVIAGALEPSYTVAGDCYDYAVNGDIAHVAIFDAMGHAMDATLVSAVTVSAYRNARRSGLDLLDTARSIDRWVSAQFGADTFVTSILAELDLRSGVWRWVTAGHPPAMLLRAGRVVKVLEQTISPPLGLLGDGPVEAAEERLEPGDRLILHSDGVTDARDANGEFFGADRLTDFVARQAFDGLPGPETLRRLMHAILAHQSGHLEDGATVVLIEWHGDRPQITVAPGKQPAREWPR